jgi:hypothetical protein
MRAKKNQRMPKESNLYLEKNRTAIARMEIKNKRLKNVGGSNKLLETG